MEHRGVAKENMRIIKIVNLFVFGVVLYPTALIAQPLDVCVNGINAVLNTNKSDYVEWKNGFKKFFDSAHSGETKVTVSTFTNSDGSRDKVADQLSRFDKFSRYAETSYTGVSERAILWADYYIRDVEYQFRGQQVQFQEPMLCRDKKCQMTTLIENGNNDSQFLNTLLGHVNSSSGHGGSCKKVQDTNKATKVNVYPKLKRNSDNPITLVFGETQISKFTNRQKLDEYLNRCTAIDPVTNEMAISQGCVLGNPRSQIPALEINKEANTSSPVHFDINVLLRVLLAPDSILDGVNILTDKEDLVLLKIKSPVGKVYAILLAMQSDKKVALEAMRGENAALLLRNEVLSKLLKG